MDSNDNFKIINLNGDYIDDVSDECLELEELGLQLKKGISDYIDSIDEMSLDKCYANFKKLLPVYHKAVNLTEIVLEEGTITETGINRIQDIIDKYSNVLIGHEGAFGVPK